ncbi:MAG TPA: helix-hairpin-helix domain-containing protein [Fimbriimonadaceae bacterium]|jgi:DNA uptake protein ComE-like DNA-binding protein
MRRKQQGAILVFTLAVLTAIVAVLAAATVAQRLANMATENRINQQRAEIAAESGLQAALSLMAVQSTSATSQNDPWYTFGTNGSDHFLTNDGSFRIQILDAGSLINLNSATATQLQNLPLTQPQIDSFLDWIQTGNTARPDGAKDDTYNGLPNPYNTAEAPIHDLDELMLINNFTPATLFTVQQAVNGTTLPQVTIGDVSYQPTLYDLVTVDSKSSNSGSTGTALTNVNTATQAQLTGLGIPAGTATLIIARRPTGGYTTLGAVITAGGSLTTATAILNNLTISTTTPSGKVDLNTATLAVLEMVPGISTDIAQSIVSQQGNTGFTTLGALAQVPGMTVAILAQCADSFTINSQAFLVRVIGTAGSVSVPLEAVITLSPTTTTGATSTATSTTPPASITKIYHPAFNNMISHWHWDNTTTNDIDLRTGT